MSRLNNRIRRLESIWAAPPHARTTGGELLEAMEQLVDVVGQEEAFTFLLLAADGRGILGQELP